MAVIALFIGIAAWQVAPVIASDYRDSQEQAKETKLEKSLRPAITALARLKVPGLTPCNGIGGIVAGPAICAQSTSDAVPVTLALRRGLKTIGAQKITAKCVAARFDGAFCQVSADLEGERVSLRIGPNIVRVESTLTARGAFIGGSVGLDEPTILPNGRDIPLPVAT